MLYVILHKEQKRVNSKKAIAPPDLNEESGLWNRDFGKMNVLSFPKTFINRYASNTPVYMALRCEVDHSIRFLILEESEYTISVAYVQLAESEIMIVHDGGECGKIAGIG